MLSVEIVGLIDFLHIETFCFNEGLVVKYNEYANKLGIHPSIIIGRLQNEKIVDYTFLHELKENINI